MPCGFWSLVGSSLLIPSVEGHNHSLVWWKKGSEVSPEAVEGAIRDAEKELDRLKGQYYDISDSLKKIEDAKKALNDFLSGWGLVLFFCF
ncbi:MAG: hypothetical protein AOA65_1559 [Candidatus Bathyarchaeota archaeon BA1]|nr:MAG: hypothetical protein AOA65_1559 [Candidatus Bathyarchaeota archaeon BA1]